MSFLSSLFDNNIKPFLPSLLPQWLRPNSDPPAANLPSSSMSALSLPSYFGAVQRCRRFHGFFFLDLPKDVRCAIYTEFFSNNTIQVCSFAKEHDGDFAKDERVQILLTCKPVAKEACGYLYFYTNWKFVSISAFSYFTWPNVQPNCWNNVRKLTLTKLDILPEFHRHLDKFSRLQKLYIDAPFDFAIKAKHVPRKHEQGEFIRRLIKRRDFLVRVYPHIYVEREWEVYMTVHADYGGGKKEIMLINLDCQKFWHRCYPVPTEDLIHTLVLPSMVDAEAELMITGQRQLRAHEWK